MNLSLLNRSEHKTQSVWFCTLCHSRSQHTGGTAKCLEAVNIHDEMFIVSDNFLQLSHELPVRNGHSVIVLVQLC